MRTACLLVPDLPLRAQLRANPKLAEKPWVVASSTDSRAEVIAVSSVARRAGVRSGGSVTHARAICPELHVCATSPGLERAARQTLLDLALSFSPRAALVPRSGGAFSNEAAVFLDASGVRTLFHSEEGFASALDARATSFDLPGVVCVASSQSTAHIAARSQVIANAEYSVRVLPPGSEIHFLAPLAVDLLDPTDGLAQKLTRFGVRTIRDLLKLPRRELIQRLGPEAVAVIARARGEEVEPPLTAPVDRRSEEAIELEFPTEHLEPLLFVLRGLLSRLVERLELRGLACASIDLELGLSGGARDARRVGVAAATRDVRVLLRLVALALETHPPRAPIESVSLGTEGQPVRSDQLDFFRPRGPDPATLDRTLSELESLCGPGRVGSPLLVNDHRPDVFDMGPFHIRPSEDSSPRGPAPCSVALRALRPPVTAQVEVQRGSPAWLRSAVAEGPIVRSAGPWRTTGRWWNEQERFAIDHFDIEMSSGTVLRLAFDWIRRSWQVDAIYD